MNHPGDQHAIMWSGGKDSCLALWRARKSGTNVTAAINFFDARTARVRFHALRKEVIFAQAKALGLELIQVGTLPDDYDATACSTFEAVRRRGFNGVVFGNIHLRDVYATCAALCRTANLAHVEPLWENNPIDLLNEFVDNGFRAIVTCCQLDQLDETWLGRRIDQRFARDIQALPEVDPCGENGEYHSCVIQGPLFTERLIVTSGEIRKSNQFAQLDLAVSSSASDEKESHLERANAIEVDDYFKGLL